MHIFTALHFFFIIIIRTINRKTQYPEWFKWKRAYYYHLLRTCRTHAKRVFYNIYINTSIYYKFITIYSPPPVLRRRQPRRVTSRYCCAGFPAVHNNNTIYNDTCAYICNKYRGTTTTDVQLFYIIPFLKEDII